MHRNRINTALNFTEAEPLQGALADMFYGCWYDMPMHGGSVLEHTGKRLRPDVLSWFEACVLKKAYVGKISQLATRWSVLITPSLDVAEHRLRISSDDARKIASEVIEELKQAYDDGNLALITQIEQGFFAHCLACKDSMAFSIVWFRLGRAGWDFDARWNDTREQLQ